MLRRWGDRSILAGHRGHGDGNGGVATASGDGAPDAGNIGNAAIAHAGLPVGGEVRGQVRDG